MKISNQIDIFDGTLLRQRRARAAENFAAHNILFQEIAEQLIDRLGDVKKDFRQVLDLSSQAGLEKALTQKFSKCTVIRSEFGHDEILSAAPHSSDLIISNLNLHWINDLPGALVQIRKALKPEGLFMAALPGESTLHELRSCLMDAELKVAGGVSPRLSPVIGVQAASALLQRAGFDLPVTDSEIITLTYTDIFALMRDLRGMGETNAHKQRLRHPTRRAVFLEAGQMYQERFADNAGRIPATFEIIFLHGWKAI